MLCDAAARASTSSRRQSRAGPGQRHEPASTRNQCTSTRAGTQARTKDAARPLSLSASASLSCTVSPCLVLSCLVASCLAPVASCPLLLLLQPRPRINRPNPVPIGTETLGAAAAADAADAAAPIHRAPHMFGLPFSGPPAGPCEGGQRASVYQPLGSGAELGTSSGTPAPLPFAHLKSPACPFPCPAGNWAAPTVKPCCSSFDKQRLFFWAMLALRLCLRRFSVSDVHANLRTTHPNAALPNATAPEGRRAQPLLSSDGAFSLQCPLQLGWPTPIGASACPARYVRRANLVCSGKPVHSPPTDFDLHPRPSHAVPLANVVHDYAKLQETSRSPSTD